VTGKALIVKLGAIGDVAMVLPAARQLHEYGMEIDWLCGKLVEPLLACYGWVHPIVVNDEKLFGKNRLGSIGEVLRIWSVLFGRSYDLCAVLQYDRRFKLLTAPLRAKRSIVLDWNDRNLKLVSERHHTAEYARILCNKPDEFRADNLAPLQPTVLPDNPIPKTGKTRIALVPGGARNIIREDPQRRWPLDSYVTLATLLLQRGYEVVLTGGPSDSWVAKMFADIPVKDCIGVWQLPETLAFYRSCDCVVTHDTGPLHLAGLSGCPLVGLFGPTSPSKFLPRRNAVIGLWGGERLACRPCYDGRTYAACNWNGCMVSITPDRVLEAVESLLVSPDAEWRVEHI
jgi:heptosyltransferase-2